MLGTASRHWRVAGSLTSAIGDDGGKARCAPRALAHYKRCSAGKVQALDMQNISLKRPSFIIIFYRELGGCSDGSNSATTNEVAGREASGDFDKKSQVFSGCKADALHS